jgi:nucleoside-diphosphate-sugar epimerase
MAAGITKRCLLQIAVIAATSVLVQTSIPRRILLLGGNGLIGSAVAERLLQEGHHVTTANRGNWNWDTDAILKPRLKFIYCDRNFVEDTCKGLYFSGVYDTVIDFSTYREEQMLSMLSVLRQRVLQYIYISTDSVYEVSPQNEPGVRSREEDAPGPDAAESVADNDPYGREKLLAEHHLLRETSVDDSLISDIIILRLPDVIGPRDRTQRWWSYQLWLLAHRKLDIPLHIPHHLGNVGLSLVYTEDIAQLVASLVADDNTLPRSGIFNLAMKETPTLRELLSNMADCLKISPVNFAEGSMWFFPSVTRGPVDISKAEKLLKWKPSRLNQVICDVCRYYLRAARQFPEEFNKVVDNLSAVLASDTNQQETIRETLRNVRTSSLNVEITRKRQKTEL